VNSKPKKWGGPPAPGLPKAATALGYSEPAMLAARDYLMRGKPADTL
jgi:hypothetical protein